MMMLIILLVGTHVAISVNSTAGVPVVSCAAKNPMGRSTWSSSIQACACFSASARSSPRGSCTILRTLAATLLFYSTSTRYIQQQQGKRSCAVHLGGCGLLNYIQVENTEYNARRERSTTMRLGRCSKKCAIDYCHYLPLDHIGFDWKSSLEGYDMFCQ